MPASPATSVDAVNDFLVASFPGNRNRCLELGPTWAVGRHEPDQGALRPGAIVSGPTVFGLADAALWYALFGAVGIEPMALTSELSIRFLRPARGELLLARADLHHVGRRSVVGSVRCWMEHAPETTVAVAQGTYVRPSEGR